MKTFLLLAAVAGVVSTIHAADRPNIIVFYTDDHGHADLSCQGVVADVKTPHIDALAASGVRAVNGYSTAPQCVPSRAGLMVGRFQNRFGVESNPDPLDGFNRETTLAERLQAQGYVTAQFGKWHLGPPHEISQHGFRHVFSQNAQRPFFANINDEGQDIPPVELLPGRYHLDACARAAAAVIERYQDEPFFLYVAFRAPHTPLDAPPEYVERFPGPMPERRRQALAMISAVDDGVGRVMETLARCGLTEKTLIFLIGDNGAPLKIHKIDSPVKGDPGGWDGSLNDPLNGEKGMLSEGGMHVPFVVAWPGVIPGRQVYPHAVSALDVAATAVEIAGLGEAQGLGLDGVNLVPFLTGQKAGPPHETLYWRWIAQSAIREGDWKLLRGGEREYLYNLAEDLEEKHNLASQEPERVARLREKLVAWSAQLSPAGLTTGEMSPVWEEYFDVYLEGKPATEAPTRGERRSMQWVARNGELKQADGEFWIDPDSSGRLPFLAVTGFKAQGPVTLVLRLKSDEKGEVGVAWRMQQDTDFLKENRAATAVLPGDQWQEVEVPIAASGRIIHLRLTLPAGARLKGVEARLTTGRSQRLLGGGE